MTRPKTANVATNVRKYLSERPGLSVYVSDMETALKLSAKQIQSAVYNRKAAGDPIEVEIAGRCWRWTSNGTAKQEAKPKLNPDLKLMATIGTLSSGESLFQDTETGCLWKAVAL